MSRFEGKTRKARKRAERRARGRPEGAQVAASSIAVDDPLIPSEKRVSQGTAQVVMVVVSAIIAHAIVLAGISAAGAIAARLNPKPEDKDRIDVTVVDTPPPPPPPPVEEPPPAPKPEPADVPPEPEKPKPKPKPKPEPKVEEPPPPAKDPIDKPPEPPPPEQKPVEQPRRIVGLNLESTVSGGSGPSFATGNTRMGETDKTAAKPEEVAPIPKNAPDPVVPGNKTATRIPIAGSKVVAPKKKRSVVPQYPEQYRLQGLEAAVVVRVSIDATGKPTNVVVVKPSEYSAFNEAAKNSAMREEYAPAMRDGVAVEYAVTFTVYFRLNE